jgi:hypothetical protein
MAEVSGKIQGVTLRKVPVSRAPAKVLIFKVYTLYIWRMELTTDFKEPVAEFFNEIEDLKSVYVATSGQILIKDTNMYILLYYSFHYIIVSARSIFQQEYFKFTQSALYASIYCT